MVDGSTGCSNNHVDAAAESLELPADWLSSVDGEDSSTKRSAVFVNSFGHLHGEFAGGYKDETRWVLRAIVRIEGLKHRQRKRSGLTGACGGLAQKVLSSDERGDRLALNGGGFFVPKTGEGFD